MAEDTDMQARERAAYRRITAAARKLAVGTDAAPLVEDISTAYHNDADVRAARRTEAIANFMEALVAGDSSKPAKGENKGKATPAESAKAE